MVYTHLTMNKEFSDEKQTWKSIFLSLIAIFTFFLELVGQQSVKNHLQAIKSKKRNECSYNRT